MKSTQPEKQKTKKRYFQGLKNSKGFTLIEIAIVLVIIGLLIGFSLKGMSLIQNAKVKRVVKMADEYRVAVMTYLDRFDRLPGDDPDTRNTHPGNGNGLIIDPERLALFQHLADAGIISGNFGGPVANINVPSHAFGDDFHGIVWVNPPGTATPTNHYLRFDNLPWDVAMEIDRKHDDGVWNSGDISASENYIEATSPVARLYMTL